MNVKTKFVPAVLLSMLFCGAAMADNDSTSNGSVVIPLTAKVDSKLDLYDRVTNRPLNNVSQEITYNDSTGTFNRKIIPVLFVTNQPNAPLNVVLESDVELVSENDGMRGDVVPMHVTMGAAEMHAGKPVIVRPENFANLDLGIEAAIHSLKRKPMVIAAGQYKGQVLLKLTQAI